MSSKWIFMCFYFTLANKLILWSFSFFASPFQVRIGDVNAAPVTEVRSLQCEKHMLAKAMIYFFPSLKFHSGQASDLRQQRLPHNRTHRGKFFLGMAVNKTKCSPND